MVPFGGEWEENGHGDPWERARPCHARGDRRSRSGKRVGLCNRRQRSHHRWRRERFWALWSESLLWKGTLLQPPTPPSFLVLQENTCVCVCEEWRKGINLAFGICCTIVGNQIWVDIEKVPSLSSFVNVPFCAVLSFSFLFFYSLLEKSILLVDKLPFSCWTNVDIYVIFHISHPAVIYTTFLVSNYK